MNYLKTMKFILALLIGCMTINHLVAEMPQQGPMMPPGFGDLDYLAMEKAVEEERAKMSPEERARFDADVEQLTKELESMSDEDFQKFVNEMFTPMDESLPPVPEPYTPPVHEPVIEQVAPVTKPQPVKTVQHLNKEEKVLASINGIINSTNSFL